MAITTTHAQYEEFAPIWEECRAAAIGQRAVHALGEAVLPRLEGQTDTAYSAYLRRTPYYNATGRTIKGLVGMLFRKDPVVEVPPGAEYLLDDITQCGVPFNRFLSDCATEYLRVGRFGVLTDYPQTTEGMTLADAIRLNLRPTLTLYRAESIINWETEQVGNVHVVTQVRLQEVYTEKVDEFTVKSEDRWRVLDLFNGIYRVRVYRKTDKGEFEQVGTDVFPKLPGNVPITRIPFDLFPCVDVIDPPLVDLVDLNLSHFRVSADYEHGTHFVGLPTPYVTGYQHDGKSKIAIGGTTMLVFPDKDTKVGFLEFTGQGLATSERNLDRKEHMMAVLGARMLEAPKREAEAAETASIYRIGENATLAAVADMLSYFFTGVMEFFCLWAGFQGEAVVTISKDYLPKTVDAGLLRELVAAMQKGALSRVELFRNLQEGEVIDAKTTFEEEQERIAEDEELRHAAAEKAMQLQQAAAIAASQATSGRAKPPSKPDPDDKGGGT